MGKIRKEPIVEKDSFYNVVSDYEKRLNPNVTDDIVAQKYEVFKKTPELYLANVYKKVKGENIDAKTLKEVETSTGITMNPGILKSDVNYLDNRKKSLIGGVRKIEEIDSKRNLDLDTPIDGPDAKKVFTDKFNHRSGGFFDYDEEYPSFIKQEQKLREERAKELSAFNSALDGFEADVIPVKDFFRDSVKEVNKGTNIFKGNDVREHRQKASNLSDAYMKVLGKDVERKAGLVKDEYEKSLVSKIMNGEPLGQPDEGYAPSKEFNGFLNSLDVLSKQKNENVSVFGAVIGNKKMTYKEQLDEYKNIVVEDLDKTQGWLTKGKSEFTGKSYPSAGRSWLNNTVLRIKEGLDFMTDAFIMNEDEEKAINVYDDKEMEEYLKIQKRGALDDFVWNKIKAANTQQRSDMTAPIWEKYYDVDGIRIAVNGKGDVQRVVKHDGKTSHNLSEAEKKAVSEYMSNPKKYKQEEGLSPSWGKSVVNMAGSSLTDMAPMIATGFLTSGVKLPGLLGVASQKVLPAAAMSIPLYADSFREEFEKSGDWNSAAVYGGLQAGTESLFEWIGGGVERRFVNNLNKETLKRAADKTFDAYKNAKNVADFNIHKEFFKNLGKDIGTEELEEIGTLYTQAIIDEGFGNDSTVDMNDVLSTLLVTPLATIPFSAVTNLSNYKNPSIYRDMIAAAADNYDKTKDAFVKINASLGDVSEGKQKELQNKLDIITHFKNGKDAVSQVSANVDFNDTEIAQIEDHLYHIAVGVANGKKFDFKPIGEIVAKAKARTQKESVSEKQSEIIPDKNEKDDSNIDDVVETPVKEVVVTDDDAVDGDKSDVSISTSENRYISSIYDNPDGVPVQESRDTLASQQQAKAAKKKYRESVINKRAIDSFGFINRRTIGEDGQYDTIMSNPDIQQGENALYFNIGGNNSAKTEMVDIFRQTGIPFRMDVDRATNDVKISFDTASDAKTFARLMDQSSVLQNVSAPKVVRGHNINDRVQFGVGNYRSLEKAQTVFNKIQKQEDGTYLYLDEDGEVVEYTPEDFSNLENLLDDPRRRWDSATYHDFVEADPEPRPVPENVSTITETPNIVQSPSIAVARNERGEEFINVDNSVSLLDALSKNEKIPAFRKGEKGTISVTEGGIVSFESESKVYELGNISDIGESSIRQLGLHVPKKVYNKDGIIYVNGQTFINPYTTVEGPINFDDQGNIESVDLVRFGTMEKVNFTGNEAVDVATALVINQIKNDGAFKREFDAFLKQRIGIDPIEREYGIDQLRSVLKDGELSAQTFDLLSKIAGESLMPFVSSINKRNDIYQFLERYSSSNEDIAKMLKDLKKAEVPINQSLIDEIKSLPLTHVSKGEGLGMGSTEAIGTYVSTEETNRYYEPGDQMYDVEINVRNPFDLDANEETISGLMNTYLKDAVGTYLADNSVTEDVESILTTLTSFDDDAVQLVSGFEDYLAQEVTNALKERGYDSIYSRESNIGEGYLIVFDKENVVLKPKRINVDDLIKGEKVEDVQRKNDIDYDIILGQAADARANGFYEKDGITYYRKKEIKGVYGKKGRIVFANYPFVSVPFRYKLVDIRELVTSHINGALNPNYFIPEAQPKSRTGIDSIAAVLGFAQKPRVNELIFESEYPYSGIPISNTRGEIIQGHNRTEGVTMGVLSNIKIVPRYIAEKLSDFGISDPGNIDPDYMFLIREVDANDNLAIELGNYDVSDLETGSKRLINAVSVSRRIPSAVKRQIVSVVFESQVDETLNSLIRNNIDELYPLLSPFLNTAIRNSIFDKGGNITKDGVAGIEKVIQQFIFEGGPAALPETFDTLPDVITGGIRRAMPYIYSVPIEMSILPEIQNALMGYSSMLSTGLEYGQWKDQMSVTTGGKAYKDVFNPLELVLIELFSKASKYEDIAGIVRKDGRIVGTSGIAQYSKMVKPKEDGLLFDLGEGGFSKEEALKKVFNINYGRQEPEAGNVAGGQSASVNQGNNAEPITRDGRKGEDVVPKVETEGRIEFFSNRNDVVQKYPYLSNVDFVAFTSALLSMNKPIVTESDVLTAKDIADKFQKIPGLIGTDAKEAMSLIDEVRKFVPISEEMQKFYENNDVPLDQNITVFDNVSAIVSNNDGQYNVVFNISGVEKPFSFPEKPTHTDLKEIALKKVYDVSDEIKDAGAVGVQSENVLDSLKKLKDRLLSKKIKDGETKAVQVLIENKDDLLLKGIKHVSLNKEIGNLLKTAYSKSIPERLYNDLGRALLEIDVNVPKADLFTAVSEVISRISALPNEKTDINDLVQAQAIANALFEEKAYAGLNDQEKFEAVIEDKQAFSQELTPDELKWVNENYFIPKGYVYNKFWDLVPQEPTIETVIEKKPVKNLFVGEVKPTNQPNIDTVRNPDLNHNPLLNELGGLNPMDVVKYRSANENNRGEGVVIGFSNDKYYNVFIKLRDQFEDEWGRKHNPGDIVLVQGGFLDKTGEVITDAKNLDIVAPQEGIQPIIPLDGLDFTVNGGNKAVNENGEPMTVYHGTGEDFKDLDETKQNSVTGHGDFGKGFYFSASEGIAKYYSLKFKNRVVKKYNINVKNPFEINITDEVFDEGTKNSLRSLKYIQHYERDIIRDATEEDVAFGYKKITKEVGDKRFSDILKENGYDAVFVNRTLGGETTPKAEIVVFEKSQIKEEIVAPKTPDEKANLLEGTEVVDEKGEPLTVYHGTNNDFEDFKFTKSTRTVLMMPHGVETKAFFFHPSKDFAQTFGNVLKEVKLNIKKLANNHKQDLIDAIKETWGEGGSVETANNGNLYFNDYSGDSWIEKMADKDGIDWMLLENEDFIINLQKRGIGGTGVWEDDNSVSYAVFDAKDIVQAKAEIDDVVLPIEKENSVFEEARSVILKMREGSTEKDIVDAQVGLGLSAAKFANRYTTPEKNQDLYNQIYNEFFNTFKLKTDNQVVNEKAVENALVDNWNMSRSNAEKVSVLMKVVAVNMAEKGWISSVDEYFKGITFDLNETEGTANASYTIASNKRIVTLLKKIGNGFSDNQAVTSAIHEAIFHDVLVQMISASEKGNANAKENLQKVVDAYNRETGQKIELNSLFQKNEEFKNQVKEKIDDFGEKIGGARKDTSQKLGERKTASYTVTESDVPKWAQDFIIMKSVKDGQYQIYSKKTNRAVTYTRFATEEEANEALPLAAVAYKHSVYTTRDGKFGIYRNVTDRKRIKVVPQDFETREDALKHLVQNAISIMETVTSFGESVLPVIEKPYRDGVQYRSENVRPEEFKDTFGFRGVEFGNWNNQEERQLVMNYAYDALLDMADVLGISPKAISLGGELGLAFGARGVGLQGAKAHYETDYAVINISKMKGAGSLAHEWMHALDHYLARLQGAAKSEKVVNTRGDSVYPVSGTSRKGVYLTHGYDIRNKMRNELKDAFFNLRDSMFKKSEDFVQDSLRIEKYLKGSRDRMQEHLMDIRRFLATERTYGRKKGKATEEQLMEFDAIVYDLLNYASEIPLEFKKNEKSKKQFGDYIHTNDQIQKIEDFYQSISGRSGLREGGALITLGGLIRGYNSRYKDYVASVKGDVQTRKVNTSFVTEAMEIDRGRTTDYWSTPHEMIARAFMAYIEDKITEAGNRSQFLVYNAQNPIIIFPSMVKIYPYPEGSERETINKEFDKFFDLIEEKVDDIGNVHLFQDAIEKGIETDDDYIGIHEYFARKGEAFMKNTNVEAKDSSLQETFDFVKKIFTDVYRSVVNGFLDIPLTKNLEDVFSNIFGVTVSRPVVKNIVRDEKGPISLFEKGDTVVSGQGAPLTIVKKEDNRVVVVGEDMVVFSLDLNMGPYSLLDSKAKSDGFVEKAAYAFSDFVAGEGLLGRSFIKNKIAEGESKKNIYVAVQTVNAINNYKKFMKEDRVSYEDVFNKMKAYKMDPVLYAETEMPEIEVVSQKIMEDVLNIDFKENDYSEKPTPINQETRLRDEIEDLRNQMKESIRDGKYAAISIIGNTLLEKNKELEAYLSGNRTEVFADRKKEKFDQLKAKIKEIKNISLGIANNDGRKKAELLQIAVEIIELYIEEGIVRFVDILNNAIAISGDKSIDFINAMKSGYVSAKITNPELTDGFDFVNNYGAGNAIDVNNESPKELNSIIKQEPVLEDLINSNDDSVTYDGVKNSISDYLERGVFDFKNIIKDANDKTPDFIKENFNLFVQAYNELKKGGFGYKMPEINYSYESIFEVEVTPKEKFIQSVLQKIKDKEKMGIVALRKIAEESGFPSDVLDTELQEYVEYAVIQIARDINETPGLTKENKFSEIQQLYETQPTISMRSSDRVSLQQYSTPIPIGFVVSEFLKYSNPKKVLEPSAGNGMLVLGLNKESVITNEVDSIRLSNLALAGFDVLSQDAMLPFTGTFDALAMNPPFGPAPAATYKGLSIGGLDQQMVINALNSLEQTAPAAIIIGGHNSYNKHGLLTSDYNFFRYLYSNYNVLDVINISGKLYYKQGTSFPIRLILIKGKKDEQTISFPPTLKQLGSNEVVNTFDDLYTKIKEHEKVFVPKGLSYVDSGRSQNGGGVYSGGNDQRQDSKPDNKGKVQKPRSVDDNRGTSQSSLFSFDGPGSTELNNGNRPDATRIVSDNFTAPVYNEAYISDRKDQRAKSLRVSGINLKVDYVPQSQSPQIGSKVSFNAASAMYSQLEQIGDVDSYVQEKLQYPTRKSMYDALKAEQVDAVALAIKQIDNKMGFIIGDQTGVGKGRVSAALVRYGILQGKKPILVTNKPVLFSDVYRDVLDIGSNYTPYILHGDTKSHIRDKKTMDVLHRPVSDERKNAIYAEGKLPDKYDFVLTSYSQFSFDESKKVSKNQLQKAEWFRKMTRDNILIFDESHAMAGEATMTGEGNIAKFFKQIIPASDSVVFLSATFAKRAGNMPVYALKTLMSKANITPQELIEAVQTGGVSLQEILSSNLVSSGQMVRRERDFTDVEMIWQETTENVKDIEQKFDEMSELFNDIILFQNQYVDPILQSIGEQLAEQGTSVGNVKDFGISAVPFASRTFNSVRQLLFSISAKDIAETAIKELKSGRKVVIAIANTMESFTNSLEMTVGEVVENKDFALVLNKGINSVFNYVAKVDGVSYKRRIPLEALSETGLNEYNRIVEKIKGISSGISYSPIDDIISLIEKAGYKVGEITGREHRLIEEKGRWIYDKRRDKAIEGIVNGFNEGALDVILLNESGSNGISLHSSETFKDQSPRTMIMGQSQLDVNQEMQIMGRVDRTGQKHRARYIYPISPIPAQKRLLIMLKAKLKSLNANVSGNQKSDVDAKDLVDFINKYGDRVVYEFLAENHEINEKLMFPVLVLGSAESFDSRNAKEGLALSVSGKMALLSVKEQETFYNEVSSRYLSFMSYLEDNGMNDLEVKTLDLEAKIINKTLLVKGSDNTNPFASDTYLEEVEVNVLRKPMKLDEVKSNSLKLTAGMESDQYANEIITEYDEFVASTYRKTTDNLKKSFDKKIERILVKSRAQGRDETRDREIADGAISGTMNVNELKNVEDDISLYGLIKKAKDSYDHNLEMSKVSRDVQTSYMKGVFKKMIPMKIYGHVTFSNEEGAQPTRTPVLFMGFNRRKGAMSPSAVTAVFATRDGRRKVSIPLSQKPVINQMINGVVDVEKAFNISVDTWDKGMTETLRENRFVITGNILQAYGVKGQHGTLVSFTTDEGKVREGILMSEYYDKKYQSVRLPIKEVYQNIVDGVPYTSVKGDLFITKQYSMYEVFIPSSKEGAIYYKNNDVLDLIEKNVFVQRASRFYGRVDFKDLKLFLDVLSKIGVVVEMNLTETNRPVETMDDVERVNVFTEKPCIT